jgi:hypothetical protein
MVEQRCLRCGALVGDAMPAVSTVHGPATPSGDALGPRPSDLPAAPAPTPNGTADGDEDPETLSPLHALRELADLHAAGVLTDSEFAAKKAELLRRV